MLDFYLCEASIVYSPCICGEMMKLREFIEKHKLPDTLEVNQIPLKHPETKEKIYIKSKWFNGFWYQTFPGVLNGRVHPCQYFGDLMDLEVYLYARKELANLCTAYSVVHT